MSRNYWMQRGAMSAAIITTVALAACGEESKPGPVIEAPEASAAPPVALAVAETAAVAPVSSAVAEPPAPPLAGVEYDDAFAVFRRGDYEEAATLFAVYARENEEDGQGQYMLGLSAWKSGDHGTAERALTRAVELEGRSVKALTNLSRVLLEQAKPREALAYIEQAIDLAPESHEVWRVYGNVLGDLRRHEDALEAYRGALTRHMDDAWSMNNYGLVLIRLGRHEDALPALARAVELAPDAALFRRNLDAVLDRIGERTDEQLREAAARFAEEILLWSSEMEHAC